MQSKFNEITFSDSDVVNPEEYDFGGGKLWLIHDHGFTLAVVFASNERDALDAAVDADKLDQFMIDPKDDGDRADYMTPYPPEGSQGPDYIHDDTAYYWVHEPTYLGNADEPFDIEGVECIELPNPKFSFCALFNAMQAQMQTR